MSNKAGKQKKKHNRSLFYRIMAWLHLWLGLVTGLIMIIVCLTACIWIFNEEITALILPQTKIEKQDRPVLPPSAMRQIADSLYPGKKMSYVSYRQGRAAHIGIGEGRRSNITVRVNPYTAQVLHVEERKEGSPDFFRFILNGHRFLWMSPKVGRVIVNYSTLIFVVILVSGIVLWWPRKWNPSTRKQAFTIKKGATPKRFNYDLHNVLGFYSLIVLACIALTGMVYGIEWYSKSLYWATSGGTRFPKNKPAKSDSLQVGKYFTPEQAMDSAWSAVVSKHPHAQGFYYSYADTSRPSSSISITIYPSAGNYYENRVFVFDQHTLKPLRGNKIYAEKFEKASVGNKIRRMNYDIHVGSILGLPGRILAFFAALIGASLPITGFIIWLGKKKKGKKKGKKEKKNTILAAKVVQAEPVREGAEL